MRGDGEWKAPALGSNGTRPVESTAPSARGPKWTVEEVDCIVLAFDACKLNPARFHAEFNDITPGRQRTLAELRLHLPRVAVARGFEVAPKFLDDCDAVIDGVASGPKPERAAADSWSNERPTRFNFANWLCPGEEHAYWWFLDDNGMAAEIFVLYVSRKDGLLYAAAPGHGPDAFYPGLPVEEMAGRWLKVPSPPAAP